MVLFKKKTPDKPENQSGEEIVPTMTIEIEKRSKNEDFSVFELNLFHRECERGKIKLKPDYEGGRAYRVTFECQRCHMHVEFTDNKMIEQTLFNMTKASLNDTTFDIDTYKGKIRFLQKK